MYWLPDRADAPCPPPEVLTGPAMELRTSPNLRLRIPGDVEWFRCPVCDGELPVAWVFDEATRVWNGGALEVDLRCGHAVSLNDLESDEVFGFSRWEIVAEDHPGDLASTTKQLEAALSQPLRLVVCRF